MIDALTAEGHEVIVAQDGVEAAQLALSEALDLIVLDVEMPGMNGYQVAHLLKDDPVAARVPLVFLTSKSKPGDRYWGLALGAEHYLSKAAPRSEIMGAMSEALAGAPEHTEAPASGMSTAEGLLGRLAGILDRRLFEAIVTSELAALAHESEDYRLSLRRALEAVQRVADFDAAVMLLPGLGESVAVIGHRVDKSVLTAAESLAGEALPAHCFKRTDVLHRTVGHRNLLGGSVHGVTGSWTAELPSGEGVLGSVALVTTDPRGFTDGTVHALERLLPTLGMVADNLRLYERMRVQAVTDGLTGAYNHRHFQELLIAESKRASRTGATLALLMADLDHFKRVNDRYGHQCGDEVLAAVASRIGTQLRQSDILARYGGEEFALLLPDTELVGATKVAERVRNAVSLDPVQFGSEDGTVTVSIGVATATGEQLDEPSDLVARADGALYAAKRAGRDRVAAETVATATDIAGDKADDKKAPAKRTAVQRAADKSTPH